MADLSQAWRARHLTPGDSIGHTDTGGVDSHTEHVITLPPEHPLCALRDLWLSTPSSGAPLRLGLLCGRGGDPLLPEKILSREDAPFVSALTPASTSGARIMLPQSLPKERMPYFAAITSAAAAT